MVSLILKYKLLSLPGKPQHMEVLDANKSKLNEVMFFSMLRRFNKFMQTLMSITGLIEGHGKLDWLFKPLLQIFSLLHAKLSAISTACFQPLDEVWASMAWLSLQTLCFFHDHVFCPTLRAWQDLISNFNFLASSRNLPCIYSANKIVMQHTAFIYLISHQC